MTGAGVGQGKLFENRALNFTEKESDKKLIDFTWRWINAINSGALGTRPNQIN